MIKIGKKSKLYFVGDVFWYKHPKFEYAKIGSNVILSKRKEKQGVIEAKVIECFGYAKYKAVVTKSKYGTYEEYKEKQCQK